MTHWIGPRWELKHSFHYMVLDSLRIFIETMPYKTCDVVKAKLARPRSECLKALAQTLEAKAKAWAQTPRLNDATPSSKEGNLYSCLIIDVSMLDDSHDTLRKAGQV